MQDETSSPAKVCERRRFGWRTRLELGIQPAMPAATGIASENNFGALRLAAAILVVYGHEMPDQTGTAGLRLLLFFAISGFLVAGSWHSDPHPGRFLMRRFLRVWPAYAAVILTCSAMSFVFPARDLPEISQLASLFYLSNLWFAGFDWGFFAGHHPVMNRSIWMMPYEIDIYLALALAGSLGRRILTLVAGAVLLASLGAMPTDRATGGLLDNWSLYFGGFFAFGLLLRQFPGLKQSRAVALWLIAGAALLQHGERTAGLLLVIAPAAVWVGERSWPVLRSASRFGDLSLGVFLWSWPVHQVTALWITRSTPATLQFAVVLGQTLLLAWLSWRFIEAPALRRRPHKPSERAAPAMPFEQPDHPAEGSRLRPGLSQRP